MRIRLSSLAFAGSILLVPSISRGQEVLLDLIGENPVVFGIPTHFAESWAIMPDVNGDGVPEVAVRSRDTSVYSGSDGAVLHRFLAQEVGYSMTSVNDVNGDGVADLVASDPFTLSATGRVHIFSGANWATLNVLNGGVKYGFNVVNFGDHDGDGVDDLLISGEFLIELRSGANGSLIFAIPTTLQLPQLARMEDLDQDQVPEIFAYSSWDIEIYSGATQTLLFSAQDTLMGPGNRIDETMPAGDINGDGLPDLLVSEEVIGGSQTSDLTVRVYSLNDMSVLYEDVSQKRRPFKLGALPDVTGDGCDEFLLGLPTRRTPFTNGGMARLHSGKSGELLYGFRGESEDAMVGQKMGPAGDFNGDGIEDLVLASPRYVDDQGDQRGRLRIMAGHELYLFASETHPQVNQEVQLNCREGQQGDFALVALTAVDDISYFLPLFLSPMNQSGTLEFATAVPPGLTGFEFTYQSFARIDGRVRASNRESIRAE